MKVDRILGIIIYLINHDNVPASYLAERFHVSVRTIQRDMVSISAIGIPVYAESGKYGGYSVLPTYKIKNSDIRNDEQQMIIKALESLATSYTSDTLKALIEKYNAIIEKEGGQKVFWDFGVTKEKKQYRTFKVARIQDLYINDIVSAVEHGNIEKLMKASEQEYYQTCIHVEVQFDNEHTNLMSEYFPDCPAERLTETVSRIFIDVPAKERLWKALLLSFGNKVKVVGPEAYKRELIETAKNFLSNYDI